MEHPLQPKPFQKALQSLRNLSVTLKSAASETLENMSSPAIPQSPPQSSRESPYSVPSSTTYQAQVDLFKQQLRQGGLIDMVNVRSIALDGCPDTGNLRLIAWKLMLGYLPPDTRHWESSLATSRQEYRAFCNELVVDPHTADKEAVLAGSFQTEGKHREEDDGNSGDHPLSTDAGSKWHTFFKDSDVLEQIERDVRRTHPDMHFFSGDDEVPQQNREAMCRALFIFAKLNMGLMYVQGMNELLAPLFWLCRQDSGRSEGDNAEADSWHLFVLLISEFRDHFCKQLDNTTMGIKATLGRLNKMLHKSDRDLWFHLEVKNKVDTQFYAFRWITLLLTQEFDFPSVLRLWDAMLCDPAGRVDWTLRMCLAMLHLVRDELLAGDFSQNLRLLQGYPRVDVQLLLCQMRDLADQQGSGNYI